MGAAGIKKCPYCSAETATHAVRCRACRSSLNGSSPLPIIRAVAPPRGAEAFRIRLRPEHGPVMRALKGVVALMTFVILANLVGTCVICSKLAGDFTTSSGKRSEAERRESAALPPIDMSAGELEAAYRINEVSADNLYKGQVLRVSGMVEHIVHHDRTDPHVILHSEYRFGGVICMFDSDGGSGLASLAPGQHVVLRGVGDGYFLGGPMLRRCVPEAAVGP